MKIECSQFDRFNRLGLAICLLSPFVPQTAAATKFQITGKVTDWRGESVTNLSVMASDQTILGAWTNTTTQTDVNGRFSLEVVPPFYLDVQLSPDDLAARGYRRIPIQSGTTTRSNKVVNFVALSDTPTAHVRGHLADSLGTPGTSLSVTAPAAWSSRYVATDAMGHFDVPVYGGTWGLSANSFFSEPQLLLPQMNLMVVDGKDQNDVALVAHVPTAQVTGDVIDSSGAPLINAVVSARASINGAAYSQSADTDSNGVFSLRVFDAVWQVQVDWYSEGFQSFLSLPAQTVRVAGSNANMHFVSPARMTNLQGRVVDNLGAPLSNVSIIASPSAGGEALIVLTDVEGRFGLGLSPGIWSVFVQSPTGLLGPEVKNIYVPPGLVPDDLAFVLQRLNATLSGSVVDSFSNTVPYAWITASTVVNDTLYSASTLADEEGRFSIGLFDGEWDIITSDQYALAAFAAPDRDVIVKTPGTFLQLVVQVGGPGAHLRGAVVDESGAALTNVYVSAFLPGYGESIYTITDAGGEFDIVVNFGGDWFLDAYSFGGGAIEGSRLLPSVYLDVQEGIDQDGIILIELTPTAQITGSIKDADGEPLTSISVQAYESFGSESYSVSATTDAEGKFSVRVLNGDWTISPYNRDLNLEGYQSLATVDVRVGTTNEVVDFVAYRIIGDGRIPKLTVLKTTNGLVTLNLASQMDQAYNIEGSTDLVNWTKIARRYSLNGFLDFVDTESASLPARVYRARWVPRF